MASAVDATVHTADSTAHVLSCLTFSKHPPDSSDQAVRFSRISSTASARLSSSSPVSPPAERNRSVDRAQLRKIPEARASPAQSLNLHSFRSLHDPTPYQCPHSAGRGGQDLNAHPYFDIFSLGRYHPSSKSWNPTYSQTLACTMRACQASAQAKESASFCLVSGSTASALAPLMPDVSQCTSTVHHKPQVYLVRQTLPKATTNRVEEIGSGTLSATVPTPC